MAKPPLKIEGEAYPDSWARFERAVDTGVKAGPQHRTPKKKVKKKASSRAKP